MRENDAVTDSSPALPVHLRLAAAGDCSPAPSVREIRRSWTPGAVVGLAFLIFPAVNFVTDDYTAWQRTCGLVVVGIIALSYLLARTFLLGDYFLFFMCDEPFGRFENYIQSSPPFFL